MLARGFIISAGLRLKKYERRQAPAPFLWISGKGNALLPRRKRLHAGLCAAKATLSLERWFSEHSRRSAFYRPRRSWCARDRGPGVVSAATSLLTPPGLSGWCSPLPPHSVHGPPLSFLCLIFAFPLYTLLRKAETFSSPSCFACSGCFSISSISLQV